MLKVNSVLCVECSRRIASRCAGSDTMISRDFACGECEGNTEEGVV